MFLIFDHSKPKILLSTSNDYGFLEEQRQIS